MDRLDLSAIRALTVEDSYPMRRIIRTLLNSFRIGDIREAPDGQRGLEQIAKSPPDLLLTDWVMPVMDGVTLARAIRASPDRHIRCMPIILLTAHSERSRVIEALDAGVNDFLCKPISAQALYDRVVATFRNPRPFIRTATYFGPDRRLSANASYGGPERRHERAIG